VDSDLVLPEYSPRETTPLNTRNLNLHNINNFTPEERFHYRREIRLGLLEQNYDT